MKLPDIIEVTFNVVKALEENKIGYYVVGALASSAFGIPRATLDVDIVADIKLNQASILENRLKKEFYVDVDMIRKATARHSSFNLIHLETMFKVDVFILKGDPFSRGVFSRRLHRVVSEDLSQKLYFASPEDIILSKLEWYKSGNEVADRQWSDILGIIKVQGNKLDIGYMEIWAERLSVAKLLEKALHDTGSVKR